MNGIAEFLAGHDRFLIATHLNPDGDGLGSAVALAMGLEAMGKRAVVFARDGVPETYRFLPMWERVLSTVPEKCLAEAWPVVYVDCNSPRRAGLEADAPKFGAVAIIDHHETETDTPAVSWIDPLAPAAGMMIYQALKAVGAPVSPEIATNLYAAISVDTGMFRYPNTTSETLRVAADLIDAGAHPTAVASGLYESWSRNRFELFQLSIQSMELRGEAAFMAVTQEMLKTTGTTQAETENIVNYPLLIRDVRVSVMLREVREGLWKASLRSKGKVNVARICEHFNGGGHRNAAGCQLPGDLAAAKLAILNAVSEWVTVGTSDSR